MDAQKDHRRTWGSRLVVLSGFLLVDFLLFFVVFFLSTLASIDSHSDPVIEVVMATMAILALIGSFLLAFRPSTLSLIFAIFPLIILVFLDFL